MAKIIIKKIRKEQNKIYIDYDQSGLDRYLDSSKKIYWEYDCNIESVPDSIAVVPFLADFLPICLVLNVKITCPVVDKSFAAAIDNYRTAYQEMIPAITFKGDFVFDKVEENNTLGNKKALLFSGGIDATSSLVTHINNIQDCITIWGSDIRSDNEKGWNLVYENINKVMSILAGKRALRIRSNFREVFVESALNNAVSASKDSWWHGFQHGIALLGQVAPLVFLNHYSEIYIASSYTNDYRPICASDPRTDSCFTVCSAKTIHDGFELDRCHKILNIFDYMNSHNIQNLPIHVCWESAGGENCGHCEKCLRTYLDCLAVNCDPSRINLNPSLSMKKIRSFYIWNIHYDEYSIQSILCIKRNILATYGEEKIPKNLRWVLHLNPRVVKFVMSPLWLLKRIYCKVKKH